MPEEPPGGPLGHLSERIYHAPSAPARLLRLAADTLPRLAYQPWHFGDSVAFEAMLTAGAVLQAGELSGFVYGFVRAWAARNGGLRPLDCTAAGHAIVALHQRTGDPALLAAAIDLARYLSNRRMISDVYVTWERAPLRRPYGDLELTPAELELIDEPGAGVFVDCLHFDPPFLSALGRATGENHWVDLGVAQAVGYVRLLQDDESGLFHHFYLEKSRRRYGTGWGRGQGWALLGLLDVLAAAPDHPQADELRISTRSLIRAMVATQREDGHWDAVVGQPASEMESSTAAFMAVGFRRAARLGIVSAADVQKPAELAVQAVLSALDGTGVLRSVSAAVWASTQDQHYWHVPRGFVVPWGQGPAVLALADLLQFGPEAAGSRR